MGSRGRGQALVEVAFVVVLVLLPMVFGLTALGRVLHSQMAVTAVAREAARTGALASQRERLLYGKITRWTFRRAPCMDDHASDDQGSTDITIEW